jgi:hypothetical protein
MFLVDLGRWLRMGVAIMFCGQTEDERDQNKNDDALFLGRENEPLPERVEL